MRTLIVVLIVLFGAVLVFLAPHSKIYGAESCYDISQLVKAAESTGGRFVDLVDVPGDGADQLLVVVASGAVQIMPFLHGCQSGPNIALFMEKPKPPSAPV